jgi:deoxyribodipyrimidine photo-lyase
MPESRTRQIRTGNAPNNGPVAYWMHREHRCRDNWGLLMAQQLATARRVPLCVFYALSPQFLEAGQRQFLFLTQGLAQTARELEARNIPFLPRMGDPAQEIPKLARELNIGALVTDFDVLRIKRQWIESVADHVCSTTGAHVFETDGRNVIPCWLASDKKEYAARTIRPKIHRLLPEFLVQPPELTPHPHTVAQRPASASLEDLQHAASSHSGPPPCDFPSGEQAAHEALEQFKRTRLNQYGKGRNVPTNPVTSRLSPYLHFGQIHAGRVALRVLESGADRESSDAYLEELIVRRELADNFCLHEPDYDNTGCFAPWASQTLEAHLNDPRPALYTSEEFERAQTHDPLWNAAQREMVRTGHMHGYMRMYWAKKILEWSETPEQAMAEAIRLNDRYQMDGRDPNGYAGIAWSMGGVHDRGWPERAVFGKIRSMTFNGAKSKFRVQEYIDAQERGSLL